MENSHKDPRTAVCKIGTRSNEMKRMQDVLDGPGAEKQTVVEAGASQSLFMLMKGVVV